MKRLYQGKYKQEFIQRYTESQQILFEWLFDKTFDYEIKYNRDIFDFNKEQLMEFLKGRNMILDTYKFYLDRISDYIEWAIEKRHSLSTRNVADEITEEELKSISKKENKYFSADYIYDLVGRNNDSRSLLKNPQDQLLIYLVFLGIKGKNAEDLLNLKYTDVDFERKIIKLSNLDPYKKDIPVDNFCLSLIEVSKNTNKYIRYFDFKKEKTTNTKEFYDLEETPYIFRKSSAGKKNDGKDKRLSHQGLLRRLESISNFIGEKLSMDKIEKSGMFYVGKLIVDRGEKLSIHNEFVKKAIFEKYGISGQSRKYGLVSQIKKGIKEIYPEYKDKI